MNYQQAAKNWFDGGDPNGMVYDPGQLLQGASSVILCKEIGELLERHYSGHQWFIEVDNHGGIIKIWAGSCSGEWGFMLKIADVQNSPGALRRAIVAAGGEILERYSQPPGRYNREAWLAAPRYATGELKPELSDKPASTRRRERDEVIDRLVREGAIEMDWVDHGDSRHLFMKDNRDDSPKEPQKREADGRSQRP